MFERAAVLGTTKTLGIWAIAYNLMIALRIREESPDRSSVRIRGFHLGVTMALPLGDFAQEAAFDLQVGGGGIDSASRAYPVSGGLNGGVDNKMGPARLTPCRGHSVRLLTSQVVR